MPKKLGRFCWHATWHISAFSIKLLVLASVVCSILLSVFVWRVWVKPLDISFAKNYIESSLHDGVTGNYAQMKGVVLYWPDLTGPLYLQFHEGQLLNKDDEVIISFDVAAISFSRAGLLLGRVLPKAIILRKPTLRLIRTSEGNIKLDLGQDKPEANSEEQFALTTRIFGYLARPGKESNKRSMVSHLEAFSIEDARLFIDDEIAHQSWSLPDFDVGFYSTKEGMDGFADITLPNVGLEASVVHIDMTYLWDKKNVEISASLNNIDVKVIAGKIPELGALGNQNIVLDAHIETILDENFLPEDIKIDISSKSGDLFYQDFSEESVPYDNLSLRADYNYAGKAFVLRDTQITLKDVTIFTKAEITHSDDRANGSVKIWIDDLKQSQISPLWPKVLRGDNSEKWIVKRMSKGVLKDISLDFDLNAEKKLFQDGAGEVMGPLKPSWSADVENLKAEFSFENMSVDYRNPLDKVTNAYGSGVFDLNKDELKVDVKKAKLGKLKVLEAQLLFDQITEKGKGSADIALALSGGVQDFMRYLSNDPINLDDDIDMDIEKVKGQAKIGVKLKFPARKDVRIKDFKISVDGTLDDVLLPDVIKTLDLSGGPLVFSVKDGAISMKGDAMLEKRPMKFEWNAFIDSKGKPYKEKVSAKLIADPNIRGLLGIDLSDFIEGSLPIDVKYIAYTDGQEKADVIVDVTPALFFVEPFDFAKPAGEKASAKFSAYLKNGDLQKITGLSAEGENFKISKSEITFKNSKGETSISSGSISHFALEETKGTLDFVFEDSGSVNLILKAGFLDARPFMGDKGDDAKDDYNAPPMKISVMAKRMRTTPTEIIKDTTLFFDIDGQGRFNQMEMDAEIGAGYFRVRFKPDHEGKRTFRLKADDAGAFLKAFNVYKDIRGGTMVIYGEPMRGVFDRNLRGKAEISNFRVVNEPSLTKLLSILSLGGIAEVLAGDGLSFEKLEADFSWLYRKGGSLLVLKDGRTSGNSLGLLFEGTFDNQMNEVNVSGTIAPMSALNEVIGSIPIIGDILTGGSGGVFAATYSITGKSDDPVISVNPLSVLTPGILRRILWE